MAKKFGTAMHTNAIFLITALVLKISLSGPGMGHPNKRFTQAALSARTGRL